jgi:hypothetical protein
MNFIKARESSTCLKPSRWQIFKKRARDVVSVWITLIAGGDAVEAQLFTDEGMHCELGDAAACFNFLQMNS